MYTLNSKLLFNSYTHTILLISSLQKIQYVTRFDARECPNVVPGSCTCMLLTL